MPEIIHFYRVSDPYGYFSNFSPHPIQLDGKQWPTSEHYFQAQKFRDEELQEQVRQASSPGIAARLGRDRTKPMRRDWEAVKDDVMRRAVRAKFTQHESLRRKLLATADAVLVEHTDRDSYWGDGGDGSGKNMLGRLLMELREALRAESGAEAMA
jgi:N-glycosidase YbiA